MGCGTGTIYALWQKDQIHCGTRTYYTWRHTDKYIVAQGQLIDCGTGTNTLWHRDKYSVAQGKIIRSGTGTNTLWHRDKYIVAQGQFIRCSTGTNTLPRLCNIA